MIAIQRVQRARAFSPPEWTVERDPAGGDFASTGPGLQPGPLPPGLPSGGGDSPQPGGTRGPEGPGRGPVGHGPGHDATDARRAKAANARRRAGTPYPVRPGSMRPIGDAAVPPAGTGSPGTGEVRVIQGTVITSGDPVGARFRTFPPPTAPTVAQTAARAVTRAAVSTALTGSPVPGTPALPQLPQLPSGTQDD
ncbi:hypothetical protein GCM10020000_87300 [Streptomyces olivoverticillatus]